jgi:hypothetical protein
MSTELRNVPDCVAQNELTQTRFWGGEDRMTCIQITQRKARGFQQPTTSDGFHNHIELTKHQARMLATELLLFAEGREIDWLVEE